MQFFLLLFQHNSCFQTTAKKIEYFFKNCFVLKPFLNINPIEKGGTSQCHHQAYVEKEMHFVCSATELQSKLALMDALFNLLLVESSPSLRPVIVFTLNQTVCRSLLLRSAARVPALTEISERRSRSRSVHFLRAPLRSRSPLMRAPLFLALTQIDLYPLLRQYVVR